MVEYLTATRSLVTTDDVAIPLPADRAASGPARYVRVPVPGATGGDSAWWTAVFVAWLYRHGPAANIHLVTDVSDGITAIRVPMAAEHTIAVIASAVDPTATVTVSGPVAGRVLAGVPGDYVDTVSISLSLCDGSVWLCADERLWTRATVEVFATQISAVSTGVGPVKSVPMLTDAERKRILVDANDTAMDWKCTDYLALLRQQVIERPASPALVQGSRTVTYDELETRANQVASRLRRLGAGPGERIGLLCPRSADFVIAAVGIMKTGSAVVPLDSANPDTRLGGMIEDAAPLVVITTADLRSRVSNGVETLLCTDFDAESSEPADARITGETISHLIYTSGSTGRPKAVLERHAALANLVCWTNRAYAVRPGDRASWLTAPGFGAQIIEWMPFLALGVPIHIGEAANPTPDQLQEWLLANKITHTLLVSALAERVWSMSWPADTVLRVMVATAERVIHWPPEGLPFKAVVTFGSTETTNVLSCLDIGAGIDLTSEATPADVRAARPVPAGKPMSNVRVYVLNDEDEPVAIGIAGQLHVAGTGMSAGYYNRPELAAGKFKPNTLPEEPSETLYNTGDIARMRTDGTIEVLGRSGSQVNIRGFRVELGEVENAVRSTPGVSEAVVVTHEHTPDDVWLVAYVAGTAEPVDVRAHAAGKLAHYMVPGLVIVLDAFPRLPNGKVDRASLPEVRLATGTAEGGGEPADPIERELMAIWTTLFRRENIGVRDHFFELGGHSLLAFRLIGVVRETFAVEITLPELWQCPTIAELAVLITSRLAAGQEA